MLEITGTESEINIVGEIFNSVLELLGGDSNHDGFGFEKADDENDTTVILSNANGENIIDTLSLIQNAIRESYKNNGFFSKKEHYLENCISR